jgi:Ca2+-transporting ATPase
MKRVARQLRDPMAILLIVAASISGIALDQAVEAIAILAIVVLNGVIALVQEGKAQQALEALRDYETPQSRVLRDGVIQHIPARELVPGDLILLNEGDRVPADARLLQADSVRVDESSLTGESLPVSKRLETCPVDTPVADRSNMVFSGTLVVHGSGRALVITTGPQTEFGRIASQLSEERKATPLQGELTRLTTQLGILAAIAAVMMLFITFLEHGVSVDTLNEAFLAAVALAVAAVPEGLATVVTIALALGVLRMASQGAIVRRLPAVETLGATTVIATDKTGTLTRNELSVVDLWISDHDGARLVCALCNDATLEPTSGDPLEVALLRWVGAAETERSRKEFEIVRKVPFDSNRKMMMVTARVGDSYENLIKGAPESVLAVSTLPPGHTAAEIDGLVLEMAGRGAKVLALAVGKEGGSVTEAPQEPRLVGLVALGDTVRSEAHRAIHDARRAGVHLVMVTGDHVETAKAIAVEVGLRDVAAMTGDELTKGGMPMDPLSVTIYARTTPEQKLELVNALQQRGEIVAVTGDGVNDAPALLRANIGVAMGESGTEVAKEASDLVITDDNLATIVAAIREGRGIYDNIRKVLEYLVAANISEVLVVLLALVLFPELGVPLLPLQLLWINLVTDGLPAIALAMDAPSPRIMERPPRARADSLLSASRVKRLAYRGAALASACLGAFAVARFVFNEPLGHARATMFVALALAQLGYAFAVRRPSEPADGPRSPRDTVRRLVSNHWLIAAAVIGLLLQVLAVSWQPLIELLGTATLSMKQWVVVGAAAILPSSLILVLEARFSQPPEDGTAGSTPPSP